MNRLPPGTNQFSIQQGTFMKHSALRRPLISTAAVLFFLLLMLSVSIANPEATVLGSAGLILLTIARIIQLLIALSIGFAVCIAFLFAVFFGAAALVSPAASARMYEEFRQTLAIWFMPGKEKAQLFAGKFRIAVQEWQARSLAPVRQELHGELEIIRSQLKTTRSILNIKIERLSARIDELEQTTTRMADSGQVAALSEEVRGNAASLAGIQTALDSMKSCVEESAGRFAELSPEEVLGDLPGRVGSLEQQHVDIAPLEREIAGMQEELASVREKVDKALSAALAENAAVRQEPPQVPKRGRRKAT